MSEFKNLTVLLSACGAQFAPGLVNCLKENGEREIRVIGIDMHYDPTLDGLYDGIYEVPAASDPKYIDVILDICKKENVDVVLPFMSAELIPLLDRKADFDKLGIKVAVGDRKTIETTINKYNFYAAFVWLKRFAQFIDTIKNKSQSFRQRQFSWRQNNTTGNILTV
jgi:carbamoyl-phosphate synthase large subunit